MPPFSQHDRMADPAKNAGAPLHWSAAIVVLCAISCAPAPSQGTPPPGSVGFDRMLLLEETSETSANVSLGDVNGDGHLDVVLVKGRHWPLLDQVLLGDGEGAFLPARPLGSVPDRSYSGLLVDMDDDGDLDVVVSNDEPDPKLVHLNDGSGGFSRGSTFGRPEWPTRHIGVADLNDGAGGFEQRIRFGPPDAAIRTAKAADLNGDAVLDIVVIDERRGPAIYPGRSDGSYGAASPLGDAAPTPYAIELADLDGDGRQDVIIGYVLAQPVAYFIAEDSSFVAVPFGDAEGVAYGFAVGDVDEDGSMDIAMARSGAPNVLYFGSTADINGVRN